MNMSIYFSALENAFYSTELKNDYIAADSWPKDAAMVDYDVFLEFALNEPPEGKRRVAGRDGLPAWADIPPLSYDEQVAIATNKKAALLAEAQGTISLWQTELQLGIISDDDKTSLIAWMKYIQALNAVDTSTAPGIEWPVKPE